MIEQRLNNRIASLNNHITGLDNRTTHKPAIDVAVEGQ
jgi:hypothetical protein